jgi:hypothetical protein
MYALHMASLRMSTEDIFMFQGRTVHYASTETRWKVGIISNSFTGEQAELKQDRSRHAAAKLRLTSSSHARNILISWELEAIQYWGLMEFNIS